MNGERRDALLDTSYSFHHRNNVVTRVEIYEDRSKKVVGEINGGDKEHQIDRIFVSGATSPRHTIKSL
jgi:hypothetical protein